MKQNKKRCSSAPGCSGHGSVASNVAGIHGLLGHDFALNEINSKQEKNKKLSKLIIETETDVQKSLDWTNNAIVRLFGIVVNTTRVQFPTGVDFI